MQCPPVYLHVAIRQETRENRRICEVIPGEVHLKALNSVDKEDRDDFSRHISSLVSYEILNIIIFV